MSETLLHPNLERVALARSSQLTEHRRAFWGVMACFLVHGLVVATWVSRIASVKSALHLGDGALGLAFWAAPSAPSPPSRSRARWWCAAAAA